MKQLPVKIVCPVCGEIQDAYVKESFPWYEYTHKCEICNYWICEGEWDEVEDVDGNN